jgi:hypothetical protein
MKVNTNPRYRGFCQTYFTAGDEEQFMKHRDFSPASEHGGETGKEFSALYRNLSGEDVTNTFRYIFHKFKKGIYIRIRDNKLLTFLPFSKAKFVNEWGDRINVEGNMIDFLRHVSELDGRQFYEKSVNKFPNGWYANNGLVRYEFPLSESDTGTHHVRDLFEQLCEHRKVPDIELFINRRDFPMLKNDGTEPYDHIWDDDAKPLVSHKYDRYVPILSHVTGEKFADIPIPTTEDWARVRSFEGVSFPKTSDKWEYDFSRKWEDRKPTCVFRGSSTGIGVTIDTNPRLKAAFLSTTSPVEDGFPLLDAGITDWKVRPRKIKGEKFLKTVEHKSLPFQKVPRLTPEQQTEYKYILNIDGHVSAFRLTLEMNMGSVILLVESDYRMWIDIQPYVHYVPVKRDLSDLFDQIRWCRKHDKECQKMVETCREYYKKCLGKDGILDYMTTLLKNLKGFCGTYQYSESRLKIQYEEELEWLKKSQKTLKWKFVDIDIGTNYPRFYNRFRALHLTDFKHRLKYEGRLSKNPLSVVGHCRADNMDFAVKVTKDADKLVENTHEAYIGVNAINNLLKSIPNFIYTFGTTLAGDLVSEYVKGVTMFEWLSSPSFNFPQYVDILLQLSLALEVAQRECGFVHYDLFPWNVMLEEQPFERVFDYVVGWGKVVQIKTCLVPIIIDYGKSHVYVNYQHYGFINMYKMSTVQDMMSIILSSANVLFKSKLSRDDEKTLISLVAFVSPNVKTYTQARQAAANASFSSLISMDKGDLEKIRPLDFFHKFGKKPILEHGQYVHNIGRVQLFFGLGYAYSIPDLGNDMIKTLYFFRRLMNTFMGIVPKKVLRLRKEMAEMCYWPEIPNLPVPKAVDYTEETFHNAEKCEELKKSLPVINTDIVDYREMIFYLLSHEEKSGRDQILMRYREIPDYMRAIADKNSLN